MSSLDVATTAAPVGDSLQQHAPEPKVGAGVAVLSYFLRTHPGLPEPSLTASIVNSFPADHDALLLLLQQKLGNGYVQSVVAAMQAPAAPVATAPAATAAMPAATAATPPPASASAPAVAAPTAAPTEPIAAPTDDKKRGVFGDIGHGLLDAAEQVEEVGGEILGVAELAGLKYPVKAYEARVDGGLYRGSRLDDDGMKALKAQGIRGVVSLCLEHTNDKALADKYGIEHYNCEILDNAPPTVEQMNEFISFARAHPPTYVHCEAGKGRTGTAVACYRIAVDGWTADAAIAEGKTFGLSLIDQIAFVRHYAETVHAAAPAAATPAATVTGDATP